MRPIFTLLALESSLRNGPKKYIQNIQMRRIVALTFIGLGIGLSTGAEHDPNTRETAAGNLTPSKSRYAEDSLSSRFLKARFYLPDAENGYYRGTRF